MQFSKELAAWRGMLGGYFEFLYLAEKPVSRKKAGWREEIRLMQMITILIICKVLAMSTLSGQPFATSNGVSIGFWVHEQLRYMPPP